MRQRPSFRGRFVEAKRATRTRSRKLVPRGRVLLALDDVIEIDGALFVPVIHRGRMEWVKTETVRLIGRVGPSSKKKAASKRKAAPSKKKTASKKTKTAPKKRTAPKRKRAAR